MKIKTLNKSIAIVLICLVAVMCFVLVVESGATASGDSLVSTQSVSFTNVTGQFDLSNIKLDNLSEYVRANVDMSNYEERSVIVSLNTQSLVQSANGRNVAEYITTYEGQQQKMQIEQEQEQFLSDLSKLGIDYDVISTYDTVLNGVAIKINTAYVSIIKLMLNVDSVVLSQTYAAPQTVDSDSSASDITNDTNVYATGIYDSSEYAEEYGGKGMLVAVLDTGLDYTHQAFQTQPEADTMKYTQSDIYSMVNDLSNGFTASGNVYVSDKVPFAYDYADHDDDVYPSYSNHGTHVAGIIAGSADSYTDKDGNVPVDEDGEAIPFTSVAPHAQLVICKVFTDDLDSNNVGGATTEDIVAALNDCVKLGVDVINMSLGTTCGFSSTDDGDDEGMLLHSAYTAIKEAGISLICAASNDYSSAYGGTFGTNLTSNPDSGTVGSPSTFASALSVASISGKKSPYILTQDANGNDLAVFYNESSDENNVDYDFGELMLEGATSGTFQYVVIKGTYYGSAADYNTSYVKKAIKNAHDSGEKIIALVKRGGNLTFQEKVENAMSAGADAIIVYNNVAGEIKMTIGDVEDPIPAISISYEAGDAMVKAAKNNLGTITINPTSYQAGPFMSNFSSWGVTSDLKLKPEITAHGGEITSSVPGGWDEQSGTSMATPNVAGLVANIRSYINVNWKNFFSSEPTAVEITQLTNQLLMSTATIVVDQEGLPYSPRKQGAGLASLDNIFSTSAYLYTLENEKIYSEHATNGYYMGAEDNRPKLELGEDENKVGKYTLQFYINNVSGGDMSFTLNSLFMTETVSLDGLAVGEQAYMLGGNAVWTVAGLDGTYNDGDVITVGNGTTKISVTLTLSDAEKAYLNKNFENGMYVEGFLQLKSSDSEQCSLSLPFMGFYGDWEAAPMLDYDAFEIAEIEQDTSIADEEKPKASVWATQAYAIYWNDKYVIPMGSYVYKQDDSDEVRQIYTTEEYSALSCYNEYSGLDENNYMTTTGIKGIYAGLLRNAKQVDCRMYNVATGELIYTKVVYRVNKAYSSGGSTTPGYVKLELTPEELGLVENGQYRMEFDFYYQTPTEEDKANLDPENTFTFSFYVDYTAPVLEDVRVRYFDYKDGNKDKQKVYLDLDIYDNHYSMAVLLCYLDSTDANDPQLQLCTEYVTPIYDAKKNGTVTVSIEITDIIEKYGDNLYIEIDDYALNHSVYQINISDAQKQPLPNSFELADGEDQITIGKYETHKVSLIWDSEVYKNANLSNFVWTVSGKSTSIVAVKNGEIVGLSAGTGYVTVSNGRVSKEIEVTVTDNNKTLTYPSISFDVILNSVKAPVKATGLVDVNISQKIQLEVLTDPWYYSLVNDLDIVWSSRDTSVATVDQEGNVTLLKKGKTSIVATINGTAYSATVMLNVEEPFKVSSYTLTSYEGAGGVVYIPTDMNIMTIGEEAFKNNTDITAVIIPKTVTTIDLRAFYGCTNLKHVFFVDVVTGEVAESDLTLINTEAFAGCTSLEVLDFSNCKTFTVARQAFEGCSSLKLVKGMEHIGTAYNSAFAGCTSLVGSVSSSSGVLLVNPDSTVWDTINNRITSIETINFSSLKDGEGNDLTITSLDISGIHVAGAYVFQNCSAIVDINTAQYDESGEYMYSGSIGAYMFYGCNGLKNITLKDVSSIGANAFEKCFGLRSVTIDNKNVQNCVIASNAFANCGNLISVDFVSSTISQIGDKAFAYTALDTFTLPNGLTQVGDQILAGTDVTQITISAQALENLTFAGNSFKGMSVLVGDEQSASALVYNENVTKLVYVNPNADLSSVEIPSTVIEIGEYAFADTTIKSITIPVTVKVIGEGAFKNSSLETITFEEGSALQSIGAQAFYGTSIKAISLPSTVVSIGDYAFASSSIDTFELQSTDGATLGSGVFANCQSLVEIDLSTSNIKAMGSYTFDSALSLRSVKLPDLVRIDTDGDGILDKDNIGMFTFVGATNIQTVVFGANSTITGDYTFFTYSYYYGITPYDKLTSVTLGTNTQSIGVSAFVGCTALEQIDIQNATTIGEMAFYDCINLATVSGLDCVREIGMYAFYNCEKMTTLNLVSVENIGIGAFRIDRDSDDSVAIVTINMPQVQTIGAYAFYGTGATTITLPSTINQMQQVEVYNIDGNVYGYRDEQPIGVAAFANAPNLKAIEVDDNNELYFDDNGVLYRYITADTYELVCYPANRQANAIDSTIYVVKAGTVRIEAYAFAGALLLQKVTLPYSVEAIGSGAFYDTSVATFTFESHYAPTLESEYNEYLKQLLRSDISFRGMFHNNFVEYILYYTGEISSVAAGNVSTLSIVYPTNGVGYDNYVYSTYFSSAKLSTYVLTDDARTAKNNIESMNIDDVSAWLESSFAINQENKTIVEEYSQFLKETHRLYNVVANDQNQRALIGEETINKLFEIESVMRSVKSKFGISPSPTNYSVSGTYKKNYVVGETFDLTGLVITVVYDDYSTQDFTADALTLTQDASAPLTTLDRVVTVVCNGKEYSIGIKVSESTAELDDDTSGESDSLVGIIVGSVIGALLVIALAFVLGVLGAKGKLKPAKKTGKEEDAQTAEDGADEKASGDDAEEQTSSENVDENAEEQAEEKDAVAIDGDGAQE